MGETKKHLYYLDILRIMSCIAVLVAHSHLDYVYWCYWSVLTFTAISGAVMLNRAEIDIRKLYTHNILRIVKAFLFWSAIYAVYSHVIIPLADGEPVRLKVMLTSIVEGHYHMWYCYMITGLFILAPCFKAVLDRDERLGIYFCIAAFVFSVLIPSFQKIEVLKWTDSVTDNIGLGGLKFMLYFVLGYYLLKYDFTPRLRKVIYLSGIPVVFLYAAFPNSMFMPVLETGIVIWLFVIARYNIEIKNENVARAVSGLAEAVFTVYLIHDLFNMLFDRFFGNDGIRFYDGRKFLFTLVLSFATALGIKRLTGNTHKKHKLRES